ncbi:YggU family protein [Candidatus Woesearchaeota archaeon]|nr:YggU family protein [Candidatus Woesearchaeota archaeon]
MDSEELNKYIKDNKLKIRVKANADENKITGYDENRNVLKVNIKSPAQYNKANIEIIKLFSKKLNKKVRIKSGLTSKEKLLVLGD